MSKALSYLTKARPEAMGAYFEFLRQNGKTLDDKTRALISVITKVANQTESGLKQYANKALSVGVTPDELLDALLMAFPAVGLTKLLWAIDVLLETGVLPTNIEALEGEASVGKAAQWHEIGRVAELELGRTQAVSIDGKSLFVTRITDGVQVYFAICTHHETNLANSRISEDVVECPLHGWRFNVATGKCLAGGRDLIECASRVDNGIVSAKW